jgi:site-specific DNA recombinase
MKPVGIYARVSSERQKEQETIASQVAALEEYARSRNWTVPHEWRFLDEGYSGASLVRPGLDRLRDRVAEGQIDSVVVLSPDRLSRKYAYQILLMEEFHRHGAEVMFLKSPPATTPEERLLTQVQGMIAEYERAQIVERSRRGKRHRARQGAVNVLSGAPYGYRYVKKTDTSSAYYEVVETEAAVVRRVYELFTVQQCSIGAITRTLNEQSIPTRTGDSRWERSVIWAMLRNPAYIGKACFGKTERKPRQRITRRLRQKGGYSNRCGANQERPREEWIEIPVPALIDETSFALAQERLESNKRYSQRRTIQPSLLQGILVCGRCGYGLYRSSTRTTKRKLYYYRCLGSDGWRHLKHAVCDCPPTRQDYLDDVVWKEVMRLLEEPSLLQNEMARRLEAARNTDPARQRQEHLSREQARLDRSVERLLTAYQESLLSLDELRKRIEPLRKQQNAVDSELKALNTAAADQQRFLRLVESLAHFQARLRSRAASMDTLERQKIVRLLVKEVIVSADRITIRHCLPIPPSGTPELGPAAGNDIGNPPFGRSYLLRSGSDHSALRGPRQRLPHRPVFHHPGSQPLSD